MKPAQIPPKGQTSCYNFFKGSRKTGKGMPDQEGTSCVTVQNRFKTAAQLVRYEPDRGMVIDYYA